MRLLNFLFALFIINIRLKDLWEEWGIEEYQKEKGLDK